MLLRVSVFRGSNSTSRRYNSYTILDLRVQMGSRICHPLHLARGNKPGAWDDMEPPSGPYEHRAHIFSWSGDACLQVGFTRYIQGVPKKSVISVWQAIEGIRSGLKIKVGWVLENSGNFLSDEHKNSSFLWKNGQEKQGQTWLPPQKNGIILGHPVDYSSAHNSRNSMKYW